MYRCNWVAIPCAAMAKPKPKPPEPPSSEMREVEVTFMRRLPGSDRYDVVTGVIRGVVTNEKVIDPDVSFVVARDTASRSLEKQRAAEILRVRGG